MRSLPMIILIIVSGLTAYGYWGAFSKVGNKVYDVMDGFIPFCMMIAGIVLLIIGLVLLVIQKKKG